MNGFGAPKRTKRVDISFEWTTKTDLRLILDDLKDLISSGVEKHHNQKKSIQIEDKWHEVEFTQKFVDKIHESTESEINGELKLVIKSRI
jgi:hypothetical protein